MQLETRLSCFQGFSLTALIEGRCHALPGCAWGYDG